MSPYKLQKTISLQKVTWLKGAKGQTGEIHGQHSLDRAEARSTLVEG